MFLSAGERARSRPVPFDADRPAVEAARRDPRRFDALYRKYVGQVYSFAVYELHDHHRAEDATAQVFLRALGGLPHFEERGDGERSTFRVWLFRIARNVLSNERRRSARRPEAPLEAADLMAGPAADPQAQAVAQEAARLAWEAVDRLPTDRRQALELKFVQELGTAEIAAVMGRSEGAVRVLVHRGLRAVASEMRAAAPERRRGPVDR
ncbi:MAG TPA: RNA polymerase sigma factor [Candidatus Limnocylindrales bacterium]|nr:RNA polymerase sigma factor [Candidatus Limnocylindrales bacterium]